MRSKENVDDFDDFDDFEKIIKSKGCKLPMMEEDFYELENGLSQVNFALSKPLLCNAQGAMFKKSGTQMFWKESVL